MRIKTALFSGVAALCAAGAVTPAAHAQSVFQKIFGIGAPPNAVPGAAPRARIFIPPNRFQSRSIQRTFQSRQRHDESGDDGVGPPDSGGPYKTMCVRSCDGFYFPLRHNARRKNFASDVRSCRNACGSDGRLFYYSLRSSDGPEGMVDLAGRKYADLPNAFAYRKALVSGCACKPDPWSYEEAARHQSYADQEAIELAKDEAFVKARELAEVDDEPAHKAQDHGSEMPVAIAEKVVPAEEAEGSTSDTRAADGSIDVTAVLHSSIYAELPAARLVEHVPQAVIKPEPAVVPRAPRRRTKSYIQRATFKPASGPLPSVWGQSKYVWPGDQR